MKKNMFYTGGIGMTLLFIAGILCCATSPSNVPQEGVYIGIISFAPDAEDITGGAPVLLDDEGYDKLQSILDEKYTRSNYQGTSIYYAIHLALANLSSHIKQFPRQLETVNILTFTDGLDNGSTSPVLRPLESKTFTGRQTDDYLAYIKTELINRTIGEKRITAFSVGVRGNDVSDLRRFTSSLMAIANDPDNFYELTDFSQLDQKFLDIANSLKATTYDRTFVITTPATPGGTKIKMTFDIPYGVYDSVSAEQSTRYLEGIIGYADRRYSLTNVMFGGNIGSSTGAPIPGEIDEYEVKYTFRDFRGYNGAEDTVQQWLMLPGSGTWQVNSEYQLGASDMMFLVQRSGVIYLVLDCSTSLKDEDVDAIRDAAKTFITTLYNR
ncbi:MAG: VWA domain-containing protein [Treponema sp.]|jgi:hypothetical protein|nr:VWA domain-containing protein [Treponema sp.]